MERSSLHDIILDARANYNKTFKDLLWGYNVTHFSKSGKEEKLKELIYDARQDRDFDYISAAEKNGILNNRIIIGGGGLDERYRKYKGLAGYKGNVVGYKGNVMLDAGGVYAPYLPLVKTPFPRLIAEELVSVQPMSDPCGLVFTTDYRYDTKKIVAKSRKLKTNWSIESAENLGACYGLNDSRINLMAESIRKEIDKEILNTLITELTDSLQQKIDVEILSSFENTTSKYSKKEINQDLYKKTVISAGLRQGRRPAKHVEFPEIPF